MKKSLTVELFVFIIVLSIVPAANALTETNIGLDRGGAVAHAYSTDPFEEIYYATKSLTVPMSDANALPETYSVNIHFKNNGWLKMDKGADDLQLTPGFSIDITGLKAAQSKDGMLSNNITALLDIRNTSQFDTSECSLTSDGDDQLWTSFLIDPSEGDFIDKSVLKWMMLGFTSPNAVNESPFTEQNQQ